MSPLFVKSEHEKKSRHLEKACKAKEQFLKKVCKLSLLLFYFL